VKHAAVRRLRKHAHALAFCATGIEHEVIDEQLTAAHEEVRQRPPPAKFESHQKVWTDIVRKLADALKPPETDPGLPRV
jgi:hypothetical protein